MAQWQKIRKIPPNKILPLLPKEMAPYLYMREYLADIIEDPHWGLMDDGEIDEEIVDLEHFHQTLYDETKVLSQRESSDHIKYWHLHEILNKIQEFGGYEGNRKLHKMLHKCLKEERKLLATFESQEIPVEQSMEILVKSEPVERQQSFTTQPCTSTAPPTAMGTHQEKSVYFKYWSSCLLQSINDESFIQQLENMFQELEARKTDNEKKLAKMNATLCENLAKYIESWKRTLYRMKTDLLGPLWKLIEAWIIEMKNEHILYKPSHSHQNDTENLDEACCLVNSTICAVIEKLMQIMNNYDCLKIQYNPSLSETALNALENIAKEAKHLLWKQLNKIFVAEDITERIVNVSKDRAHQFSVTFRLLGGHGLTIDPSGRNYFTISLRAYQESKFQMLAENCLKPENSVPSMWRVAKSEEKFGIHDNRYVLRFTFDNVTVRDVATDTRRRGHDGRGGQKKKILAAEEKNILEAFMNLVIDGTTYPIKAYTLPMMFYTQPSQHWLAKGSLVWYTAFSGDKAFSDRKFGNLGIPLNEQTDVPAKQVVEMLANVFKKFTQGGELTSDHKEFLLQKLTKIKPFHRSDMANVMVKKDSFLKAPKANSFSFWKWFLACINLVDSRLKVEWKKGYIYGFCTKAKAEEMLRDTGLGTYLLRFSESAIEQSASATYPANLTVVVKERDPSNGKDESKAYHIKNYLEGKNIEDKSLGVVVRGMEIEDPSAPRRNRIRLLRQLYPSMISTEDAFCIKASDDKVNDDCYVTDTEQRMLINLWDLSKIPKLEDVNSPFSTCSEMSVMSPESTYQLSPQTSEPRAITPEQQQPRTPQESVNSPELQPVTTPQESEMTLEQQQSTICKDFEMSGEQQVIIDLVTSEQQVPSPEQLQGSGQNDSKRFKSKSFTGNNQIHLPDSIQSTAAFPTQQQPSRSSMPSSFRMLPDQHMVRPPFNPMPSLIRQQNAQVRTQYQPVLQQKPMAAVSQSMQMPYADLPQSLQMSPGINPGADSFSQSNFPLETKIDGRDISTPNIIEDVLRYEYSLPRQLTDALDKMFKNEDLQDHSSPECSQPHDLADALEKMLRNADLQDYSSPEFKNSLP